ncbi:MAG: biotin/lipoyl-containing protein [Vicinamibacterales bacterium]
MQHTFSVNGRVRTVTLAPDGPGWMVSVDGESFRVDAADVDGAGLSLLVGGAGAGRSVAAVVVPGRETGELDVAVGGQHVAVRVVSTERARRRGTEAAGADGPQRVVAPMPGKVVRVLVAPGDEVRPRQGLVVVEAMKMENELRAARAGTVASVAVVEGQSVDAGALLAVVE